MYLHGVHKLRRADGYDRFSQAIPRIAGKSSRRVGRTMIERLNEFVIRKAVQLGAPRRGFSRPLFPDEFIPRGFPP